MAALAGAGAAGFGISENGARPLLQALEDLEHAVADALRKSDLLSQQPALGTTPAATVYKPFLATVASDHAQGAVPVLDQLQTDLRTAHQVINQAMINYQDAEQANMSGFDGTPV